MPLSQIETASLSTALNAPTATALSTASGSAPSYSSRAWVNFNGTGTVAIRASGNVSSITDNGTGNYTVNFTTAISDANYSVTGSCTRGDRLQNNIFGPISTFATTSCSVQSKDDGGNVVDSPEVSVAVFR